MAKEKNIKEKLKIFYLTNWANLNIFILSLFSDSACFGWQFKTTKKILSSINIYRLGILVAGISATSK